MEIRHTRQEIKLPRVEKNSGGAHITMIMECGVDTSQLNVPITQTVTLLKIIQSKLRPMILPMRPQMQLLRMILLLKNLRHF